MRGIPVAPAGSAKVSSEHKELLSFLGGGGGGGAMGEEGREGNRGILRSL